jgi:N utilization substance protein A
MMTIGYESLVNIPGVGSVLADAFFEKGIYSAEELAESVVEELVEIRGIGQEKAAVLIENARQFVIEAAETAEARRKEEEARRNEEETRRSAEEAAQVDVQAMTQDEEASIQTEEKEDAVPLEAPSDEPDEPAGSNAEPLNEGS